MARAVSFLDILGFKQLLQDKPLDELAAQYEEAVLETADYNARHELNKSGPIYLPNHKPGEPWCHRQIFSDSKVLIALDESEESCLKLLLYTRLLFILLLGNKLPVRGAVAAGQLYHNPQTAVTLGDALTEAYLMEQQQEWAGVCIADSVWDAYPNLIKAAQNPGDALHYYFLEYQVPWKSALQAANRIMNWRFNTVIQIGSRELLQRARLDQAPGKFQNVIRYLEHVRASGALHFGDGSPKPAECFTVWLGPTQPPFAHGDDL
jgi:hypothetical protein